eukprot:203178_1
MVHYGNGDGYVPTKYEGTYHGVAAGQAKFDPPSGTLTTMLKNAQADHKQCLEKAAKDGKDPVDLCALTWGEVHQRWREFSAYRPPFETDEAMSRHRKFWANPKNVARDGIARAVAGAE